MALPANIAQAMVEVGWLLYDRGLVAGSEGNISVRLDPDRILITPSGLPKGRLEPEDLVVVDIDGRQIEGRYSPSSELPMHLYIYRHRPDIHACVHSHAPYATSFAVAGIGLPDDVLPEAVLFVGAIALTDYAPPGTAAVGESLAPSLASSNAFLLRNHGLLTIGNNLRQATHRHETVEQYARIVHLARQLGNVDSIPAEDKQRLQRMRQRLSENPTGSSGGLS